jgi:hypothetical protein
LGRYDKPGAWQDSEKSSQEDGKINERLKGIEG